MMNRTSPVRRHTRLPVRWPVVYGCDEFLGEGTVLDLTHMGWRVAGCMPVTPGMQLTIRMWPPDKPEQMRVEQATVLWTKGCEFAIDMPEMAPNDQAWVTEFLDQKLGVSLMPRRASQEFHQEVWAPTLQIATEGIAQKTTRDRTELSLINNN